jgi:hypothetical protein
LEDVVQFVTQAGIRSIRFVTIAPRIFVTSEGDATEFDVEAIKRWVEERLPDLNYIGIIEAAYYPTWPEGRASISWHAHLLVFDMHYRRFLRSAAIINSDNETLIPGVDAVVSENVSTEKLGYKVRYMSKFPTYRYRPSPLVIKTIDSNNKPIRVPTGRFGQNKDALRTGELIRMCRILAHLGLDQMWFARGTGEDAIAPVMSLATAAIRFDEERRGERAH